MHSAEENRSKEADQFRKDIKEEIKETPKIPKGPYAEVCTFDNTKNMTWFMKKNYIVSISDGLTAHKMRQNECVFDTCAAPNLVREHVTDEGDTVIKICESPRLRIATNQPVKVLETTTVYVQMGDSKVHVTFGVVKSLAVSMLLETSIIDKIVKGIFHRKGK